MTNAQRCKAWYQNLRTAGLCIACQCPSPKHVHCRPCRLLRNRIAQAKYISRKQPRPPA